MATIPNTNSRPGIERFYGFLFGDKASGAMTSDQEILKCISRGKPFEAFGKLYHKGLIVTEVAALIAIAACGTVVKNQDGPVEAPVAAQPQIAYFTRDTIQGDPVLVSQLAGVQNLSGKGAGCFPATIMVEGGKAGGETAGFCTKDNVIKSVVVRGERDGIQQTVNEDLITREHQDQSGKTDMIYIEYGKADKKGILFTYDPATKITTWHFPGGGTVEFPAAKGPFEELVGKLLEPGGVAAAAEIDTPPATATSMPATPTSPFAEMWDMNQPLPPLNSQNAEFESDSQGGGTIHFTVEGQSYAVEIPRPEVIDGAGIPIAGGEGKVTVKLYPLKVAFIDQSGGEMAWYDAAGGQWTRRYETLFVHDSWPEFPQISWIENSLGFEKYETSFSADSLEEFRLTVSGRIKRVYTEKVWYPAEKRFVELTWASVTYDKDGQKTLETLLFTDTEFPNNPNPWVHQNVQIVGQSNDRSSFIPSSLFYRNDDILQAVESSAFVEMKLSFWKESERDGSNLHASDPVYLLKYGYDSLNRLATLTEKYWDEHRGLARAIISGNLDRPELKELDDQLQGYSPVESGVRIGFAKLWIFAPDSGN